MTNNLVPAALSIIFICALVFPAYAYADYSNEEWKEILHIGNQKDNLTGAELSLNVEPDQYFRFLGDEVILTGRLKGIFGPLSESGITLERRNESGCLTQWQIITDNEGFFEVIDVPPDTGIISYQAQYGSSENHPDGPISSKKQIIRIIPGNNATEEIYQDAHDTENTTSIPVNISADAVTVELSIGNTTFIPGEIVRLTGTITDSNRKPIPYQRVLLHPKDPEGEKPALSGIEGYTKADGSFSYSYHVAGPDPISFQIEFPAKQQNERRLSDTVIVRPIIKGISPPVKTGHDTETLTLYADREYAYSKENITLYGWYEGQNNNQSFCPLELVWYNFGEQIWDRYQNSSDILTNREGLFECRIVTPETTGMYLLSVKRSGNTLKTPLFSNVLAISIAEPEEITEFVRDTGPGIFIGITPPVVTTYEEIYLIVSLVTPENNPIQGRPVMVYGSDDNQSWTPVSTEPLVTDVNGTVTIIHQAQKAGYHYFKALAGDTGADIIESETLVMPVLDHREKNERENNSGLYESEDMQYHD